MQQPHLGQKKCAIEWWSLYINSFETQPSGLYREMVSLDTGGPYKTGFAIILAMQLGADKVG